MWIDTAKNKIRKLEKRLSISDDIQLPASLEGDPIASMGFIMHELRNGKALSTHNGDLLVKTLDSIGQ